MYQNGHYGAAMLAYAPVGFVVLLAGFVDLAMAGGVVAVGLSMLPDVDQRVPGLDHRGPTHTVWFALLVGVGVGLLGAGVGASSHGLLAAVAMGAFGVVVGTVTICSHIAADALTPMGVTPLAPVDDRHISYNLTKAKNPIANYALLVLGGVVAGGAALFGLMLVR